MDSFASFFGLNKKDSHSNSNSHHDRNNSSQHNTTTPQVYRDTIIIEYLGQRHNVDYRHIPGGLDTVTVSQLKDRCKELTGVSIATMQLKVSGAYVKGDASLKSSGIYHGAVVSILGQRPTKDQVNQTSSGNPEEAGYMMRINAVTQKIEPMQEKLEEFEFQVATQLSQANESTHKQVHDLGKFLSESLMQALITLDGVDCPSEFEIARMNRRNAVKTFQALLDRVDQSILVLKNHQQQKL